MNSTFIVAELSANHGGSLDIALETIIAIKESGADAVKLQTYRPESLSLNIDNKFFGPKTAGPWKGIRPYDLYKKAATPYEWHHNIFELARSLGLVCFSSPFDFEGVDLLESLGNPIYKIASFEINDIPLIKKAASTGKPIIMSTGVASKDDIRLAIDACTNSGNKDITLLKCTSDYPSDVSNANLLKMNDLKDEFNVKIGLSDHSPGYFLPCLAVAMGAEVIEKHFVLSRDIDSPDAFFSMTPSEFKEMVLRIRDVEKAKGHISYDVSERDILRRRSLFAIEDISIGEVFSDRNIKSLRPGVGISPAYYDSIIGKKSGYRIEKGSPILMQHISD
jgi:pseudaminic acid synthase